MSDFISISSTAFTGGDETCAERRLRLPLQHTLLKSSQVHINAFIARIFTLTWMCLTQAAKVQGTPEKPERPAAIATVPARQKRKESTQPGVSPGYYQVRVL